MHSNRRAEAFDGMVSTAHHSAVTKSDFRLDRAHPLVVGSFGGAASLAGACPAEVAAACDVVEIRLDLLPDWRPGEDARPWSELGETALLFTARRADEGGAGGLDAATRRGMLVAALDDAACVDIEAASIPEMTGLIALLAERKLPWIASFHDFTKLPADEILRTAAKAAKDAGAAAFKVAAMLESSGDLARLAEFQLADHGIPVAAMGMGPLAPVSRLLCAQCGSVLNYGYLGETATAPGQWDAALLKTCVARCAPFPGVP